MTSPHTQPPRRTALVTGASSGIGSELAQLFAAHDHDLVLVARSTAPLDDLARTLSSAHAITATVIGQDLSTPTAAADVHAELRSRGIQVDVLVNNAGFNVYGPFAETDHAEELRMLAVNVVALTSLTKLLLPGMLARGFGRILNVASTASFSPAPLDSTYAATKAYVLSFSEALAEELRGTGVTVTALCPGPTDTDFARRAAMLDTSIFTGRLMTARDVAAIGYRALARGKTIAIAGLANRALVLVIRFSPRALVTRIAKRMLSRQGHAPTARVLATDSHGSARIRTRSE